MKVCFLFPLAALLLAGPFASAQSRFFSGNRGMVTMEPFVSTAERGRSGGYEEAMLRPERREARAPGNASNSSAEGRSPKDRPMVAGRRAVLRRGIAYAPEDAPQRVKELIWAVNKIRRLPYKWGGGHGSFSDNGYDCSGTVSYALHHAGALSAPLSSRGLREWGERGRGRWVTIYARNGHVFAVIAGLRLDAMGEGRGGGPTWYADMRSTRGFDFRTLAGL